jgi:DNA-directed RNA polymerase beta subunit
MERDCLVGHGSCALMQERLFTQSDPYQCYVCTECGLLAEPPCARKTIGQREAFCRRCDTERNVKLVPMPYATKLLLQELMGTSIVPRIRLGPVA